MDKHLAATGLKEILPKLELDCEDARRCLSVVTENLHASRARFDAMMKTGVIDESVMEFHMAAVEIAANLAPVLEMCQQIEMATNELVKGAQGMAPIKK